MYAEKVAIDSFCVVEFGFLIFPMRGKLLELSG